ncbi:hypothetical protein OIE66_06530 [Nonomuraea sp. NBC_01738]|uniref:hypothetical protein n=1 Tax=Nonomuraea sp. NBC_01738 TaxID=2976003 RepID=UPI002E14FE8D|nr:hypothetical protein OIE66_06530 [Nonomuraea sp. NBC_01738]
MHEEPFALTVDQVPVNPACQQALMTFAEQTGTRALWATKETVESAVPAVMETPAADDDHLGIWLRKRANPQVRVVGYLAPRAAGEV